MVRKLKLSNFRFDSKHKKALKDLEYAKIIGETIFAGRYKDYHCLVSIEEKENGSKVKVISFSNDKNTLVELTQSEYKEICDYFNIKDYKTYNTDFFSSRPLLFIEELSPNEIN